MGTALSGSGEYPNRFNHARSYIVALSTRTGTLVFRSMLQFAGLGVAE